MRARHASESSGTAVYFSDHFGVERRVLDIYGAFNISVVIDLPLFIDPFLLFNSRKRRYRDLHREIIRYLKFLRDKAQAGQVRSGLLEAWFMFSEVRQTWLGFTQAGNRGKGLGRGFAVALHGNLHRIFGSFGREQITKGSHLEKLCLIKDGVGRDNISDFTTNLIKGFLCEYTQEFARRHIAEGQRRTVTISKVCFNYHTETWESADFDLPWVDGSYVLLTPRDLLTKDDTWINKSDLVDEFERLPNAVPNDQLRAQISNYFLRLLPQRPGQEPTRQERNHAAVTTILQFPQLIDVYIRYKEDNGNRAQSISKEKVAYSDRLYIEHFRELRLALARDTKFYEVEGDTYEEAHQRVAYLKDIIENKGGHRIFYVDGRPVEREDDVHILYRLCWYRTGADVSREVDDGRGSADFKISKGSRDKTIVEFKLAKNSQLRRNIERQVPIYQRASDAGRAIKVIIYFSEGELRRINGILRDTNLMNHPDIVLIDASRDNKPSGSKA